MIHSFRLFGVTLYPFWICAAIGACILFFAVWRIAKKRGETRYIMPRLLAAAYFGALGALAYDTLFKYIETKEIVFGGISFYGGLIAGAASMWLLLRRGGRSSLTPSDGGRSSLTPSIGGRSSLTPSEWMDELTLPFLAFHFCGRIGCFLGGCCYGRPTESFLGVYFPDIPEENIFHHGEKLLPAQLFEAAAILVIALLLATLLKKHRFMNYLILYPFCRFALEFLRGDDRGATGTFLSPSQLMSLLIIIIPAFYYFDISRKKHFERGD